MNIIKKPASKFAIFAIVLIALFTVSIPFSAIETKATSELTLPGGYDTTGLTQAQAICEVAVAQDGLSASALGVTEGWCADFVFSCAKAAGISASIIPYTGYPPSIYLGVLEAGGYEVSTAAAGDLVCYFNGDYCYHIGIAINSTQAINGNWGNDDDFYSYVAIAPIEYYDGVSYRIIRPNYSDGSGGNSSLDGYTNTSSGSTYTGGDVSIYDKYYLPDYPIDGEWCLLNSSDGSVVNDVTNLFCNSYGWWYVYNGRVAFWYNGLAYNPYGCWYIRGGQVIFDYTGIAEGQYGWWKVTAGKVDFDYNGLAPNEYGWWYLEDGKVNFSYNGIVENEYGYWLVRGGQVRFDYTGIAQGKYGWWKIDAGLVNFDFNGLAPNEYGWWYLENGQVNFSYSGIVENEYGYWLVRDGEVRFDYTGIAQGKYGWWKIDAGLVNFDYNGLASNEYGWWYLEDGKVDFSYDGLVSNEYGTWLVLDGEVRFDYSGTYTFYGTRYYISGGLVV